MPGILPSGETVTLVHRAITSRDSRGNDVFTETNQIIDGCAITAGASQEVVAGTEMVASDVTVYFPDGTSVLATDAMILPDGNRYQVQGSPNQDKSPWSGVVSFVQVQGRLVTGSTV